MNEQRHSLSSKIARLRDQFIEQMPGRMEEALHHLAMLRVDPNQRATAANLHRFLHSIKGTGNSFGFEELGSIAASGEHLVARLLEMPLNVSAPFWDELAEVLARIVLNTETLRQQGASSSQEHDVPRFEMAPIDDSEGDGGRRIYICDDDPLQVEQLATQLQCFGYHPVTFTDPAELHTAMMSKRPSLVIMDIFFPNNVSGTDVLAAIEREKDQPVPAIFISARDDFEARLNAVKAGGEAYFHKPVNALDMVTTIDELTVQKKPEPYRVLIVDDEPVIAAYHSLILQEAHMVTFQVHKPERVLEVLHLFRPDLVLMDMYMPGCNGRDLAKLVRQVPDYFGLPIVFLSSETDKRKQFSAMRVGAEGFLTKPIHPEDLVAAVAIRAERMRALRMLMARDSLTGLFNHSTTTQMLENAIANAGRQNESLCFAMIDVDRFKAVNDTHGHPVGDQVLLALARVLQQRLRNSDIVGRYGGEEFAVILQGIKLGAAAQIIDQLREDFAKIRFNAGEVEFSCSFSGGVAAFPQCKDMKFLREAADSALYKAKEEGRNRVVANNE
ncbi:MAG: diguanylate cyclase [Proteobacteria bacterium]|nr:diguanylate cyclase [Pseudomonadota bacterium]MBU4326683.1 diguanylate cyclase [Pseudomonadota bacterium]MBU4395831.1 diguanylate cyclase [Pseudomonadota bacterium]